MGKKRDSAVLSLLQNTPLLRFTKFYFTAQSRLTYKRLDSMSMSVAANCSCSSLLIDCVFGGVLPFHGRCLFLITKSLF